MGEGDPSTKRRSFGNIVGHVSGVADTSSLGSWTASQFNPTLDWSDVEWIRDQWKGKLILKGIMNADDARMPSTPAPTRSWSRTTAAGS